MTKHEVLVFKEYPLQEGQKIQIADGFRHGDWLVVKAGPKKLRLRCPVSGVEIECDKSYYFVEERTLEKWPAE